jgi:hypothetical protein
VISVMASSDGIVIELRGSPNLLRSFFPTDQPR